MTKALDAIEFGLPMDIVDDLPVPRFTPFRPAQRHPFDSSNLSSSESESGDADGIYAPSVSASQPASFLQAFEQLGESLHKFVPTSGNIPEMSPQCSVDPVPIRKQRAIVQVQKDDLEDHEIVTPTNLFEADVAIADSYLAIERVSGSYI